MCSCAADSPHAVALEVVFWHIWWSSVSGLMCGVTPSCSVGLCGSVWLNLSSCSLWAQSILPWAFTLFPVKTGSHRLTLICHFVSAAVWMITALGRERAIRQSRRTSLAQMWHRRKEKQIWVIHSHKRNIYRAALCRESKLLAFIPESVMVEPSFFSLSCSWLEISRFSGSLVYTGCWTRVCVKMMNESRCFSVLDSEFDIVV